MLGPLGENVHNGRLSCGHADETERPARRRCGGHCRNYGCEAVSVAARPGFWRARSTSSAIRGARYSAYCTVIWLLSRNTSTLSTITGQVVWAQNHGFTSTKEPPPRTTA